MTAKQAAKIEKLLADNPSLDYRDARDLLMEYGVEGITAGRMAAGRPGSPE